MLVTPAATAQLITVRFARLMGWRSLVGLGSPVVGLYLSYWLDAASGATIVLVETACSSWPSCFGPRSACWPTARRPFRALAGAEAPGPRPQARTSRRLVGRGHALPGARLRLSRVRGSDGPPARLVQRSAADETLGERTVERVAWHRSRRWRAETRGPDVDRAAASRRHESAPSDPASRHRRRQRPPLGIRLEGASGPPPPRSSPAIADRPTGAPRRRPDWPARSGSTLRTSASPNIAPVEAVAGAGLNTDHRAGGSGGRSARLAASVGISWPTRRTSPSAGRQRSRPRSRGGGRAGVRARRRPRSCSRRGVRRGSGRRRSPAVDASAAPVGRSLRRRARPGAASRTHRARPRRRTRSAAPSRRAATAWFAPLPPSWCRTCRRPDRLAGAAAGAPRAATRSTLTDPTTMTRPLMGRRPRQPVTNSPPSTR